MHRSLYTVKLVFRLKYNTTNPRPCNKLLFLSMCYACVTLACEKMDPIPVDRAKYDQKFEENRNKNLQTNRCVWNRKQLNHVKNILATADSVEKKTSAMYYYAKKYELMKVEDEDHVITKRQSANDDYVHMVAIEDYFLKLWEAHSQTGHGGRDKMLAYIRKKWRIPRSACEIFVTCCETCNNKRNSTGQKGVVAVVKPEVKSKSTTVIRDFNGKGQIDLIDFTSTRDSEYSWLMIYQDHATKFLHLRPIYYKHPTNVADELLKIFFTFGAPCIIQGNDDREFIAQVIKQLNSTWPHNKITQGKPRNAQIQGIVRQVNEDVESKLRAWMVDHNCTNWSRGCYQIQWTKNTSLNPTLKRSPYEALLGPNVRGSSNNSLPADVAEMVDVDSDLEALNHFILGQ